MTLKAMKTGVSGLKSESEAMGVVADNLANVSTVGFKRQRSEFQDVLNRSGGGQPQGAGSRFERAQQLFTQGALSQTGVSTDVAVTGDGFFVVSGSIEGITGSFYSRAGQFRLDSSGYLVNPAGLKVMGRRGRADGTLEAGISPLQVPTGSIPARPTTAIQVAANLDSSATAPAQPWDAQNPADTANFSTSIQIFDSLGVAHSLSLYFNKTADGQWDYHALAVGSELSPSTPGTNAEVGAGSLSFTSDGALSAQTESQPISVNYAQATAGQTVELSFGSTLTDGGTGLEGTTQFSMPSGVSSSSGDGNSSGALGGITIDSDGSVEGQYTNGERLQIGQLVVASFRSTDGLGRAGNGLWVQTNESGEAALGAPGSGGRGSLASGALESANVDLGEEMVEMIRHQRAYSADSKVIATADEMLSALMQIKK